MPGAVIPKILHGMQRIYILTSLSTRPNHHWLPRLSNFNCTNIRGDKVGPCTVSSRLSTSFFSHAISHPKMKIMDWEHQETTDLVTYYLRKLKLVWKMKSVQENWGGRFFPAKSRFLIFSIRHQLCFATVFFSIHVITVRSTLLRQYVMICFLNFYMLYNDL